MTLIIKKLGKKKAHNALETILEIFPEADVSIEKGDVIFTANEDDDMVGFAHVKELKNRVVLQGFGVKEKNRGKGIGTALLTRVMREYEKSCKPIFLKVKAENPAVEMYSKYGFVPKKFGEVHVLVRKRET